MLSHQCIAPKFKITSPSILLALLFICAYMSMSIGTTRPFDWSSYLTRYEYFTATSIVKCVPGIWLLHVWWLHKNSVHAHITSRRARLTALKPGVQISLAKFCRNKTPTLTTPLLSGLRKYSSAVHSAQLERINLVSSPLFQFLHCRFFLLYNWAI